MPPRTGDSAFIDPRTENPLDYIILDLLGTFLFVPHAETGTRAYERAVYTIKTLRLNARDALVKARESAYTNYRARLREYISLVNEGSSAYEREACIDALKAESHPTVWREMQRQHRDHPKLRTLFEQAPEALSW